MIFLTIIAFMCIVLLEVPGLIKNKYWKELAIYSVLLSMAFFIAIMQILQIQIPNPIRDTQYFVKNLMHLSYD